MKRLLISAVLFCGVAWCQTEVMPPPDPVTHAIPARFQSGGLKNGHFWRTMTDDVKLGYVIGARDNAANDSPCFNTPLTFGEIRHRVDAFYDDDVRNQNIPIVAALCYISPAGAAAMASQGMGIERARLISDSEHK